MHPDRWNPETRSMEASEGGRDCYHCTGTGSRDYGSKRILPRFYDGIAVDPEGRVIELDLQRG